MRVGIFMLMGLYCVWKIKSNEATVLSVKKQVTQVDDEKESSSRDKEYLYPPPLVSPYGGTLKLLVGISTPISLIGGRSLSFGINFQFQYPLPQNATFFTNYFDDFNHRMARRWKRRTTNATSTTRSRRNFGSSPDKTRSIFYRSIESTIDSWGGNGSECLMKSICEAAETPLWDQGLVGQLIHVMLTPSHQTGNGPDTSNDSDDYLRASIAGKNGYDCSCNYPACPEGFGLLDRISKLDYV